MIVQLQVLNKVLSSGDISLISKNNLTEDFFSRYKNEYNFIKNHYKQYEQVPDTVTFLKSFPEFEIIDVNESDNYLIKEIHRDHDQNDLIALLNKARDLIIKNDLDKAKAEISKSIANMNKVTSLEAVNILSDISRFEEYEEKCEDFKKFYVSTGFKELDKIIGGWDLLNDYSCIIARAGVGKSWCLLKSVQAAVEKGMKVGLYAGEMTVNKVSYRFDTLMSHISNTKLIRGNSNVALEYKKYLENLRSSYSGDLFVLTPDLIPGDPTVESLESFIDKYNLDILFVDQQTLLYDSSRAKMAFEKAANISKALKMLQVRKRIPIITVTQQNRSAVEEGKFAGTENVAGSDRIAQDCTTIISVSKEEDIMQLHIVKARDGGTGRTLSYSVDLDHGKWEYIPSEDDGLFTNEEDNYSYQVEKVAKDVEEEYAVF